MNTILVVSQDLNFHSNNLFLKGLLIKKETHSESYTTPLIQDLDFHWLLSFFPCSLFGNFPIPALNIFANTYCDCELDLWDNPRHCRINTIYVHCR